MRKAQRFYWSRYCGVTSAAARKKEAAMKTICNHAADASNALDAQGRQDRTRQGIPASDASNAAGKQDYGKQDKTRWRKHSTLHLARRDPRLERVECHTLGMQFAIA